MLAGGQRGQLAVGSGHVGQQGQGLVEFDRGLGPHFGGVERRPRSEEIKLRLRAVNAARGFETVRQMNREISLTVLMIEQNARQGLQTSHRGDVMEQGLIAHQGDAADLLADPEVRRAFLGAR